MDTRTRRRYAAAFAALFSLTPLFSAGCGEEAPPDATPAQLDEAKAEREQIIQKEYGGAPTPAPAAEEAPAK